MNPANLPFDSEAMLQGLRAWVECESPTWDAAAVNRMLDLVARDMAVMGATIERISGRDGFGGVVRARFPHPRQGEPGILIAGHMDTVHPVGTIEKLAWRRDGNKCYGPGIFDMKGGNYLTLEATHVGSAIRSRASVTSSARRRACTVSAPPISTTNSSPPYRTISSPGRASASSALPIAAINRSPSS